MEVLIMRCEHPLTVLARFSMVSAVTAKVAAGMSLAEAIAQVAKMRFVDFNGRRCKASCRTLYRQIKAYKARGIEGLYNKPRPVAGPSLVLTDEFLRFMKRSKIDDPESSIPDIIECAEIKGIIDAGCVSRSTAWRAAVKMGLPLFSDKAPKNGDMRRWAYPHRLQMVLCDGLHFRAGVRRAKRVAFFFHDDATRFGLGVEVVESETAVGFLRGLHHVLLGFGRMGAFFVDNGSGFIAGDAVRVFANLNVAFIHGAAGYPEGRGKIERFNRTVRRAIVRTFDGDPTIDTACSSLTQRLRHYLAAVYNLDSHESLNGQSPQERWDADSAPLEYFDDIEKLASQFILTLTRKVSRDNVIKYSGKGFETPSGYAGTRILVYRHLLYGTLSMVHQGRMIELHEVDLTANACHQRRRQLAEVQPDQPRTIKTAARLKYDRDHATLVDGEGNFAENKLKDEE
jgi:hypothetical protein